MRILCLIFLLTVSFNLFAKKEIITASQKEKFEQMRWTKILKLIEDEEKTIGMAKKQTMQLKYRLFELKSEKIKLFKEKENKEFVAKKKKFGKNVSRTQAFSKTLALYKDAQKYGKKLLSDYPKSRYKAAIFYTMALNSRDFAYDKSELPNLLKAIKHSSANSEVRYLATTSLAEYYYNNKKYKKAVREYEKIISNKNDEWLSKNLYNYGWCLLKTHKFNDAINILEQGYTISKDEFYIDMRDQIITSLVSFYVYGKQIDRGIKFIHEYAVNKNEALFDLARKSSGKGHYKETEVISKDLESMIDKTKEQELYADFKVFQFNHYNQYQKTDEILATAKVLGKIPLTEYQREESIRQIAEVVGAKQIILKKDFSKFNKEYDEKILTQIITYFNILSTINSKEKAQYDYFKGETYYSIQDYKKAMEQYKISLSEYDKKPSTEDLRLKNLDAVFSCIDIIEFKKGEKRDNLEFAYQKYLGYWPNDKKALDIYPRLFKLYLSKPDYSNSQVTLDRYIKEFKKENKSQKDLFNLQLDLLIKNRGTKLLSSKIKMMQKGYLGFPAAEVKKSETILANILFGRFQEMNKNGERMAALKGYEDVYKTEFYPESVKAEASFNMGMIYTDLKEHADAIRWYQSSFDMFNKEEKSQKRSYLEKMAVRTELLHDFSAAAKVNRFILKNYCTDTKENKIVMDRVIYNHLALNEIGDLFSDLKDYKKCAPEMNKSMKQNILSHLYEFQLESDLLEFIDDYKLEKEFDTKISIYYEQLFWKYYGKDRPLHLRYLRRMQALDKVDENKLLVKSILFFEAFEAKVTSYSKDKINTNNIEDPNVFSELLQKRLSLLQPLIESSNKIIESGHARVSILAFDTLIKLVDTTHKEILNYKLPIEDSEFQAQFRVEMLSLANSIQAGRQNYIDQIQSIINKSGVLAEHSVDGHPSSEVLTITDIRIPASTAPVTFDIGQK